MKYRAFFLIDPNDPDKFRDTWYNWSDMPESEWISIMRAYDLHTYATGVWIAVEFED